MNEPEGYKQHVNAAHDLVIEAISNALSHQQLEAINPSEVSDVAITLAEYVADRVLDYVSNDLHAQLEECADELDNET